MKDNLASNQGQEERTGTDETSVQHCQKRMAGADRRTQLIAVAAELFSKRGLHGTTTQALADAARITEPTLYLHFQNKEQMYRAAVERNIEARLQVLNERVGMLRTRSERDLLVRLCELTIAVCISPETNSNLTNWALLEAPEYAADLHRNEIGAVRMMWRSSVERCIPQAGPPSHPSMSFIEFSVNTCLAFGFWLAALGHKPETARGLASQFADGVERAAFCARGLDGAVEHQEPADQRVSRSRL